MSITADWQFIDAARLVVVRALPDGSQESALASREDVAAWLAANPDAGTVAQPETVPQQVTKRQGRLALLDAGKYQMVLVTIEAMASPEKERALIEWDATTYERASPFVASLGARVGLDDAALDALFTAAALL